MPTPAGAARPGLESDAQSRCAMWVMGTQLPAPPRVCASRMLESGARAGHLSQALPCGMQVSWGPGPVPAPGCHLGGCVDLRNPLSAAWLSGACNALTAVLSLSAVHRWSFLGPTAACTLSSGHFSLRTVSPKAISFRSVPADTPMPPAQIGF